MLAAARIQQDQLKLKESAVQFLDQSGQLSSVKTKCLENQQNDEKQNQILSFSINISLEELCQIDAELANMVANQPSDAHVLFQEVCYTATKALGVISESIKQTQIHINLRISSLPQLPCYILQPRDYFASKFASRFYQFVGTVCSMTSPAQYTRCAKYKCPLSDCYGSDENKYIRLHTAGAKETQTVRKDFLCFYCGAQLEEDVHGRVLGEKVIVRMVFRESSSDVITSPQLQQSVKVFVRDDLIAKVFLGGCFYVVGIPTVEFLGARIDVAFEANNIMPIKLLAMSLLPKDIPHRIRELYADRKCSPWSFSTSLAYLFASDIAPPGIFHKLKLHLLLSLVQSPDSVLDILAVAKETHIIHRLLSLAASPAVRCVQHSSLSPLFGAIQKDLQTGAYSIDAGSVLLSHDGVCLLGNMDVWRKDAKDRLRMAMESRSVTLEVPWSIELGPLQTLSLPLESTLWGYVTPPSQRATKHTDIISGQDVHGSVHIVPEGFGVVVMCDNSEPTWEEYKEACLIHHSLASAMDDGDSGRLSSSPLTMEDFQQFIRVARQQSVELTEAARRLIKGYFVGSRRVRASGVRGTPFPPAALKTLTSMASAHAKLCLRTSVTEDDATLAIMLYEESITARFGYSVLCVHPCPHFRGSNISAYLGPQNDELMQQFQQRLLRFCASHDPDFSMHCPED